MDPIRIRQELNQLYIDSMESELVFGKNIIIGGYGCEKNKLMYMHDLIFNEYQGIIECYDSKRSVPVIPCRGCETGTLIVSERETFIDWY